jgi:hypothetical protein
MGLFFSRSYPDRFWKSLSLASVGSSNIFLEDKAVRAWKLATRHHPRSRVRQHHYSIRFMVWLITSGSTFPFFIFNIKLVEKHLLGIRIYFPPRYKIIYKLLLLRLSSSSSVGNCRSIGFLNNFSKMFLFIIYDHISHF